MLSLLTMALTAALTLPGQDPQASHPEPTEPAESTGQAPATLFTGATFHLGDEQGTRVSALLVREGRVVEFGEEHEFAQRRIEQQLQVVNLGGGHVVPGLQDSHCDVLALGRRLREADLAGVASEEEALERIAAHAETLAEDAWILAHGWEPDELPAPDSEFVLQLTARFPTRPVRVLHSGGSAALLNRRALSECAIEDKPDSFLKDSLIERDAEGRATGLIFGRALDLVDAQLPAEDKAVLAREILDAQSKLLGLGLTAVHDMGVTRESEEVYRALIDSGQLKLRVVGYLDGRRGLHREWLERGPVAPDENDRFCIQGVAIEADGDLSTCTVELLAGYAQGTQRKASWLPDDSELRELIATSMAAGLQPAVRTTGDRASRYVLDVYEEIALAYPNSRNLRPRLEGALVVSPKDWARFPQLGVLPSMQPIEATSGWIEKRLPEDQVRGALAWRDVAPDLGRIAFGSHFPHRDADPRLGLHAARVLANDSSSDASESVAISELVNARAAIAGYTLGAAHAAHQDDRRGRLFVGYWADMTVFDRDPIEGAASELLEARVKATLINGEVVWRAGEQR